MQYASFGNQVGWFRFTYSNVNCCGAWGLTGFPSSGFEGMHEMLFEADEEFQKQVNMYIPNEDGGHIVEAILNENQYDLWHQTLIDLGYKEVYSFQNISGSKCRLYIKTYIGDGSECEECEEDDVLF